MVSGVKFLVDENLPREVPDLLRSEGHDAVSVADRQMTKAPDPTLADLARAEGRAIFTFDLDFAVEEARVPRLAP
jgi:predicted nuclease of predicted toxin-antitoxin system